MGSLQPMTGGGPATAGSPSLKLLDGGRSAPIAHRWIGSIAEPTPNADAWLLSLALDAIAEAAMFVSRDGQILYANRAAKALLDDGNALRTVRGAIETRDPEQRAALNAMIGQAALGGPAGALSLTAADGERVNITATRGDGPGAAAVLLLAAQVRRGEGALVRQLQAAFGLTLAETDIARGLGIGASPAEIAATRGASLGTVQCQIKSVAAKMGVRRQSEIAAIVQAMPRLIDAPAHIAQFSAAS